MDTISNKPNRNKTADRKRKTTKGAPQKNKSWNDLDEFGQTDRTKTHKIRSVGKNEKKAK